MSEIRMTFTVDRKTADRIDRYWHTRRLPNRADGLRRLVKQGLLDLEDPNEALGPTQKQIDLVRRLCRQQNIEPPDEYSIKAYSAFIATHLKKKGEKPDV